MSGKEHIWQAAQNMIDRFGDDALRQVDKRAEELREHQEWDAHKLWLEIRKAVEELLERSKGGDIH